MAIQTTVTCGLPSLFSVVRWASGPAATRVRTDPGIVMVLPPHVVKSNRYRELRFGAIVDSERAHNPLYRGSRPSTVTEENREVAMRALRPLGFQPNGRDRRISAPGQPRGPQSSAVHFKRRSPFGTS